MERPVKKKERGRCTVCKRKRRDAIAEQVIKREPCNQSLCELDQDIQNAIEDSFRLNITPKEKNLNLHITPKEKKIIEITKKG